jgi:4-diphosphocytidyl-2-C-methyl-D-erythritol kinase
MTLTTVAPAKINWTLEVLGKRDDGYHEIRSVMQTIELHDELSFEPSDAIEVTYEGQEAPEGDLVARAAEAFAERTGGHGARISVRKRVLEAAGLGGGSSDAAATLRGLNQLWGVGSMDERLAEMGSELGSDVAFFSHGGTALAEGRGERVTPLPDAPQAWLVLLVPAISLPAKTRAMYSTLRAEDFTDGSRTAALVERLATEDGIEDGSLCNAFERAAYEHFPGLGKFRDWLIEAGAGSVHLCGAGPALFALASGEPEARAIRGRLNRQRHGERVHVVRTVGPTEATLVWDA